MSNAILRVKDENGNVFDIVAIVGPRGPKGDPGVGLGNIHLDDVTEESSGKTLAVIIDELWQDNASMGDTVEAHTDSENNPHNVTAQQVGAVPAAGGVMSGNLELLNWLQTGTWGVMSASANGSVIVGENCYIDYSTSQLRYKHTHPSLGARGIFLRPTAGVYMFDTGNIATTADQEFAPEFIQLGAETALDMPVTDLNSLLRTGFYNGSNMANAPGAGWYYIINMGHHFDHVRYRTQIAINFEGTEMRVRTCTAGTWNAWSDNLLRRQVIHQSTAAPTAADGNDGDVWHQYV